MPQSTIGHDFEKPPPNAIRDRLKTNVGKRYRFIDDDTVEIRGDARPNASFAYKISGSKNNRICIQRWRSFAISSLTDFEMVEKVFGTVKHCFARGDCQ